MSKDKVLLSLRVLKEINEATEAYAWKIKHVALMRRAGMIEGYKQALLDTATAAMTRAEEELRSKGPEASPQKEAVTPEVISE